MNKSYFYNTIVALTLGLGVSTSVVMAQTVASIEQPAVSISDLETAISSATPDLVKIQALTASLLAQNPDNMAAVQALAANASPEVQAAINAGIGATGAISASPSISAPSAPASTGTTGVGAIGGGGASGNADDLIAAARQAAQAAQDALAKAQTEAEKSKAEAEIAKAAAEIAKAEAQKAIDANKPSPS